MRIVLGAAAEEGTRVARNGAAWEAGGVLGGGVDADSMEATKNELY